LDALKGEMPPALRALQRGNVAPVDLAQASIGPGMAIFSRYARILEPDGSAMRVRTALSLINETLDEIVAEQEGEFDGDTRWAVTWFQVHKFVVGPYGDADVLARARDVSVEGLVKAGIVNSGSGKVRLLSSRELRGGWDPATDRRPTVWEATHHLARLLDDEGEAGSARLAARLGSYAEAAKDLAYRLYLICDRKDWTEEATGYNRLVASWPEIQRLAAEERTRPAQASLEL
jgi:putative DNA methylase